MTIVELGNFTRPLLVCGGAYGNLEALEALAELQHELDVPDDHIVHTGDTVAYCADAEASAQFVAERGWHAIKGNVEEQLAAGADDCGCGFEVGSACDAASARWYAYAQQRLSSASKAWMAGLPGQLSFTMAGLKVRVVHGSVQQTNRFMFNSLEERHFEAEFAVAGGADVIVAGHTGIPFTRVMDRHIWHNSGALGMPANDGTCRVWVSLMSTRGDGGLVFRHLALHSNVAAAARKIRAAGLLSEYANGLTSGLWPALDILPDKERRLTGVPLEIDGEPVIFVPARYLATAK